MRRDEPGFARYPRRPVVRVNDLLAPDVPTADVLAALAALGIAVAAREQPLGTTPRAVVTPTAAGTVITFEQRQGRCERRGALIRRLARLWDSLVVEVENRTPGPPKPVQKRTNPSSDGS